ncbi:hypothetical protein L1887_58289 [Cichorium endivia]|nr:hypothetical protein L1887_58289 [Cichorium endivia]
MPHDSIAFRAKIQSVLVIRSQIHDRRSRGRDKSSTWGGERRCTRDADRQAAGSCRPHAGKELPDVIGGCDRDRVLARMEAGMQDLLVKVRIVEVDLAWCAERAVGALVALLARARHALGLERRLVRLQHHVGAVVLVKHVEVVVVAARQHLLAIGSPQRLELVKDAVVLVQVAQLGAQMVVDGDRLDRLVVHVDVPDLEREVVARQDVASVAAELDVGYAADDLAEERLGRRILLLLKLLGVRIAQRRVVRTDIRLAIRVDRDRVDVQKVGGVLPPAPLDLVDLFLDLERFEVVELGLVGLELGVELVLAALFLMGLHGG